MECDDVRRHLVQDSSEIIEDALQLLDHISSTCAEESVEVDLGIIRVLRAASVCVSTGKSAKEAIC